MDALTGQGLPPGWALTRLGDLGMWTGGGTPSKSRDEFWTGGNIPWVSPKDMKAALVGASAERITEAAVAQSAAKLVPAGSVLCVVRSGILQHTFPVALAEQDVTLNQDMRALTPADGISADYLRHYLRYRNDDILHTCSKDGTTVASIEQPRLHEFPVPLAPTAEQTRIVAAVNALFEEVEAGEAALARAREGLTQFRASLLHAACTGALTADWRAANPASKTGGDLLAAVLRRRHRIWESGEKARDRRPSAYPRPPEAVVDDLPPLPAGWTWTTVAQLSFVSGGLTKNASRSDSPMQLPYLRVANVGEDRIDLTDLRKIGVTEGELPRITLVPGDLLFVEGNGSADQIGRVALWSGQVRHCVHQNHLIKARPVRRFLGRWMRDWFMSPLGKQFVQAAASSTSGLHTLSISKIEGLPVPIPPAVELRRVLPRCAALKREHADGVLALDQQSDALTPLRQSILHAAFTGRLVPQDPADAPAAALLALLRAAPTTTTRRPRQRRTATQPDLIETPA